MTISPITAEYFLLFVNFGGLLIIISIHTTLDIINDA